MQNITIKDSAGADCVFTVIRQPAGNVSAVLHQVLTGPGMNRTAFPKIEVSQKITAGKLEPVVTIAVPYGSVVDGAFVKQDQVTQVIRATQKPAAPELARADCAAFAEGLLANEQIQDLFAMGALD